MKQYEKMTLVELEQLTDDYIRRHWDNGGRSEFDLSINDISRAVIAAYLRERGACFMGKINDYDCNRFAPVIRFVEYTGQDIFNFEYDFIIPCNDEQLRLLIVEHNREKPPKYDLNETFARITAISSRIAELDGIRLWWA